MFIVYCCIDLRVFLFIVFDGFGLTPVLIVVILLEFAYTLLFCCCIIWCFLFLFCCFGVCLGFILVMWCFGIGVVSVCDLLFVWLDVVLFVSGVYLLC